MLQTSFKRLGPPRPNDSSAMLLNVIQSATHATQSDLNLPKALSGANRKSFRRACIPRQRSAKSLLLRIRKFSKHCTSWPFQSRRATVTVRNGGTLIGTAVLLLPQMTGLGLGLGLLAKLGAGALVSQTHVSHVHLSKIWVAFCC